MIKRYQIARAFRIRARVNEMHKDFCDCGMPIDWNWNGKYNVTAIIFAMLCGTKCWTVFCFLFLIGLNVGLLRSNKINATEIRMLRWMSCNIRKDSIWYEEICLKIRVALIDKKDEGELFEMVCSYASESD